MEDRPIKTYLIKERALQAYKVSETEIDQLIEQHRLDTALVIDTEGHECLVVYDDDLAAYVADRDITPEKFAHLRGNLLGLTEAGLKYGVATGVISGWVQQGKLDIKGYAERNKKLIDEADIAFLVALGRAKGMRPGKKPFS